ncbi:Flp pilus assembly protein CpaB [Salsuginibacillus kocurii]|uniref:Flp pilus assembly protein CpaB n=1 Tax=Salsuginibacillus kocurii TaxID=427078 RepID=UPI00037FC794|nr:Flp pilus assembly protein CpaB [Salsuginibacillus kocurii]
MRPRKLVLFAVAAGLITTVIFLLFINQLGPDEEVDTEITEEMAEVLIAAAPINENEEITEESLQVTEVPEDQLPPNAVQHQDMVRDSFATGPIEEGEVIVAHRIQSDEDPGAGVTERLEPGMRAMSIEVDYVSSVSNLIEPGDYVDVMVSRQSEADSNELTSELLVQEVRVLSVGQRTAAQVEEAQVENGGEEGGETPTEDYQAVTLELSVEDTVAVVNGSETGTLQLSLHSTRTPEEDEDTAADPEQAEGLAEEPIQESAVMTPEAPGTEEEDIEVIGEEADNEDGTAEPAAGEVEAELEAELEAEMEAMLEEFEAAMQTEIEPLYFTPYTYAANIREAPSLSANVQEVVEGGSNLLYTEEVEWDEDDRSWVRVEFGDGHRGWISSRILQIGRN